MSDIINLTPDQVAQYNSAPTPEPAPAPSPATTPADPTEVTLTPEQQAEYHKSDVVNPFEVMTPEQLADYGKESKGQFSVLNAFRQLPPEQQTPDNFNKAAKAYHLESQQPMTLPSIKSMAGGLWDLLKSGAERAKPYLKFAADQLTGTGAGTIEDPATVMKMQRDIAEGWAASEASVGAMGNQAAGLVAPPTVPRPQVHVPGFGGGVAQTLGEAPEVTAANADERIRQNFSRAIANADVQEEALKGKGAFMQAIGSHTLEDLEKSGFPVREDVAARLAASDPLALEAFGKAFAAFSPATKMLVPEGVQKILSKYSDKAAGGVNAVIGRGTQAAGWTGEKAGKLVEKAAHPLGIASSVGYGLYTGDFKDAAMALLLGEGKLSEFIKNAGETAAKAGKGLKEFGAGVAGPEATGPVSQAVKDLVSAAPGALGKGAEGALTDLAFQAGLSNTPEAREGFVPMGTAFGAAAGLRGVAMHALGGQIIGERPLPQAKYGVSNSGLFPALDAAHKESMAAATPKEQEQVNALQQFNRGLGTGADVYYSSDPAKTVAALQGLGQSNERAFTVGGVNGVHMELTAPNGQKKNVVIFKRIPSAPHEIQHAMDAVLGDEKIQELNAAAKSELGQEGWDQFARKYAYLLNGGQPLPAGSNVGDFILEKSGFGPEGVRKKYGANAPQDWLDNWRTALTPEEQQAQLDRYIGAEVRAENSDALFKHTGGNPRSFTSRMANAVGGIVAALGGNPLEGRESNVLGVPLRFGTLNDAAEAIAATKNALPTKPVVRPPVPPTPPPPVTPEDTQKAAEQAQNIAGAAANTPRPGTSGTAPGVAAQTDNEALGRIAKQIAAGGAPTRIHYFEAQGDAGRDARDAAQRRAEVESARNLPDSERQLIDRVVNPYGVVESGKGPQILVEDPASLVSNALRITRAAAKIHAADPTHPALAGIPFEMDWDKGELTSKGWTDLMDRARKFSANQRAGFTGAGNPLEVPAGLEAEGVHNPVRTTDTAPSPIPQNEADFINMLYGEAPPRTPRTQEGTSVAPKNVIHQIVATATGGPERIVEPSLIPANKAEAKREGVEPGDLIKRAPFKQPFHGISEIKETNPTRGALENAMQQHGVAVPKMSQVVNRLNLSRVHSVEVEPNLPRTVGGNRLTLGAGFQPPNDVKGFTDFLDRTSPDEYRDGVGSYAGKHGGGQTGMSFDIGAGVKTPEEVAALAGAQKKFEALAQEALKAKDFQTAIEMASKSQAAREAYEAATDTGGAGDFIRKYYNPDYKGPMAKEEQPTANVPELHSEMVNYQPPTGDPRAIRAAAVKDADTGKIFEGPMHFYAHAQMLQQGYDANTLGRHPQGFVTNTPGEFLTRQEAFKRAEELKQLKPNTSNTKNAERFAREGQLVSERTDITKPTAEEMKAGDHFIKDFLAKKEVQAQPPTDRKKQTESKEFTDWFGDSKVVDAQRRPLVLYHGTTTPLERFESKRTGRGSTVLGNWETERHGIFLTEDPKIAHEFATQGGEETGSAILPVYARAESPIDLSQPLSEATFNTISDEVSPAMARFIDRKTGAHAWTLFDKDSHNEPREFIAALKKLGYDSATFFENNNARTETAKTWVVFDPNQVKSATGNTGEFSSTDIRLGFQPKRKGPETDKDWTLKPSTGGTFTKAWIDPKGKLHQFGSQWHHDWMNSPEGLGKKYGIPKGEDGPVRIAALKKGFLRVNLDKNNGLLTLEVRSKDWPDQIEAVRQLVHNNLGNIDRMEVNLLSDDVKRLEDKGHANFLETPKGERVDRIPFTGGLTGEAPAQVGMAGEEGSQALFNKAVGEKFGKGEEHKTMFDAIDSLGDDYQRHQPDNPDMWNVFENTKTGALKVVDKTEGGWKVNSLSKAAARKISGGTAQFGPEKPQTHPKVEDFKDPEKITDALQKPGWAIITGTQKEKGNWDSPENKAANGLLESRLTHLGYKYTPIKGSYEGVDQGPNFLVQAISPDAAKDLGNEFGQESVITNHGLVYGDGSVTPVDHTKNIVGDEAMKQPGWSQVEGGPAFSMGLDFSKKIEPKDSPVIVSHPEKSDLENFTKPIKYSKKALEHMTKTELQAAFPEAETPGHGDKIDKQISPAITDSPLYKQAGSEDKAVKLFSRRLVDMARKWQKNPIFQDGARWYSEIVPLIKQHYGDLSDMFAELLAATSPQNDPANNFALANDAINLYKRGLHDPLIQKYNEGLTKIDDGSWEDWFAKELESGQVKDKAGNVIERGTVEKKNKAGEVTSVKPKPLTEAAYLAHWLTKHDIIPKKSNGLLYGMHSKAVLQVLARQWLRNTTGLKTQNFIQNLIGAAHEATIDIWAGRIMRRLGYSGHTDRWRLLPANTAGVSDPDFLFSQKVFRTAADELGMEPDALQGALWFAEKHLWADNGWSRLDLGDYRKEIPKREQLDRDIELNLAARKGGGGALPPMTLQP